MDTLLRACIKYGIVIGLLTLITSPAFAIVIEYSLAALGGNNFRYEYKITNDGSLGAGVAVGLFDIAFDSSSYAEPSLTIVTSAPLQSLWSETILPSLPGVAPQYDVFALGGGIGAGASEPGFAVEFEWLAGGLPGSQFFQIFDPLTFNVLETGNTIPADQGPTNPLPVPSTLLLLLAGVIAARRR